MTNTSTRWIAPILLGALFSVDADAQLASGRGQQKLDTPNVAFGAGADDVINFENNTPGEIVTQLFSKNGIGPVGVMGVTPSLAPANTALIFDSSNPTGGDTDLGTPNVDFGGPGQGGQGGIGSPFANTESLGNLLILAEDLIDVAPADGLVDDPDDADQNNSSLSFDFSLVGPVLVRSITVVDFEPSENPPIANFFGPGGMLIASQNLGNPGDNGVLTTDFSIAGVETLVVEINGSGAIDAIVIARDCNGNGIADPLDIEDGTSADCNDNGIPDECDIASGTSDDCDANGVPDECEPDCDGDGITDACDDPTDCFDRLCAIRAIPDDCATGILGSSTLGIGGNFDFITDGEFLQFIDGTATLKGTVQSGIVPSAQFDICINFSGKVTAGDPGGVPAGSPKLQLDPSCYLAGGGTIDTDTWCYYTSVTGTAIGMGSIAGAELAIEGVGPAFQVGDGANGKNANFGASGWLMITTTSQPASGPAFPELIDADINVDLVDCPDPAGPVSDS